MPSITPSSPLFRDVATSLNPKYPKTKESLCPFYRWGRAGLDRRANVISSRPVTQTQHLHPTYRVRAQIQTHSGAERGAGSALPRSPPCMDTATTDREEELGGEDGQCNCCTSQ